MLNTGGITFSQDQSCFVVFVFVPDPVISELVLQTTLSVTQRECNSVVSNKHLTDTIFSTEEAEVNIHTYFFTKHVLSSYLEPVARVLRILNYNLSLAYAQEIISHLA